MCEFMLSKLQYVSNSFQQKLLSSDFWIKLKKHLVVSTVGAPYLNFLLQMITS